MRGDAIDLLDAIIPKEKSREPPRAGAAATPTAGAASCSDDAV
jgi:hypothetical protein